jgi:hypothetical protein
MTKRTDNERIALLDVLVERIVAEPALQEPFSIELKFKDDQLTQNVTEPSRLGIRSLLMEVRKLDAPSEDAYLPDLIDIVAVRTTDPEWKKGLADARANYDQMQIRGRIQIDDGQGAISPRVAFELWAYGEHLHDDPEKVRRLEQMGEHLQPFIRSIAVEYMDTLARIAVYVRAVIRNDPGVKASLGDSSSAVDGAGVAADGPGLIGRG